MGAVGGVLVFIVIFSALASSLDSLLAATADLITQDIYRGHIHPGASDEQCHRAGKWIIVGLGVVTWLLCYPRLTTLASLLYFTGAFVASAIWPIVMGLYFRRASAHGASLAMIAGTLAGLYGYFAIGFYVAALLSSAASLLVMLLFTWLWPERFDFTRLQQREVS
jgi:Na+/proline symporter